MNTYVIPKPRAEVWLARYQRDVMRLWRIAQVAKYSR